MKFKYFTFAITPLAFLFGCSGGIKTTLSKPVVKDISQWQQQYEQNFERINSFEGSARLTIESLEFSGHVSVKVYWIRPDTLFIQAEGPLGLDVGKMFIGKSRYLIYNQFNNEFLAGNIDDRYMSRFLQTDLYLKDLKPGVLGRPLDFPAALGLADADRGIFRKRSENYDYRFVVNPATGLLDRWEKIEDNQIIILQEFKNYRMLANIYFPYLIQITFPVQEQRISIFYKEIVLNEPINSEIYTIEINPKVKQLNVN